MLRKLGWLIEAGRVSSRAGLCIPLLLLSACDVLWEPIESTEEITSTPQAIDSITVEFDVDQLTPPGNETIKLTLPGKLKIVAKLTDFENTGDGNRSFIWRGDIKDDPGGTVVLSVINGKLLGDIHTSGGRMFTIRYIRRNVALVEELDAAKFPREEAAGREIEQLPTRPGALVVRPGTIRRSTALALLPPHVSGSPSDEAEPPSEDAGPAAEVVEQPASEQQLAASTIRYVDVLVLYTAGAAAWVNGDPELVKGKIDQAISDTNNSYKDSLVDHEVRLAFHKDTKYTEQSALDLDWLTLKDRLDSRFQEVNGLITTHQADVVVLLTKVVPEEAQGGSCGAASQMHKVKKSFCASAVAVVPINCATTLHSFAHELGHVMGADHNNGAFVFSPPFDHSRGYVHPGNKWRTIMAEPTTQCAPPACPRIRHWSNPYVEYAPTEFTGSPGEDNAKSLNLTASYVSEFSDECITNQLLPANGY